MPFDEVEQDLLEALSEEEPANWDYDARLPRKSDIVPRADLNLPARLKRA